MRDEITVRLTHLNNQWERLQRTVAPKDGLQDRQTMLRGMSICNTVCAINLHTNRPIA